MNAPFEPWECWARPVAKGAQCGHRNTAPARYQGIAVCELCGATKHASDARRPKGKAA